MAGFDRTKLARLADGLVVAIAVVLPWSTSATSILLALWFIALVPTLDWPAVRRELMTPLGGLPVLLVLFGVVGMAWADVSWLERWKGLDGFYKLLAIPLLTVQFRRSDYGKRVFFGFLAACVLLLVASYVLAIFPELPRGSYSIGVPVKSYISQSSEFLLCIAVLLYFAVDDARGQSWPGSIGLVLLSAAFLANILFVATGRTTLVLIPVLAALYGLRRFKWRGIFGAAAVIFLLAGVAWTTSPYFRERVGSFFAETEAFETSQAVTSAGERIVFWTKSLKFIAGAPLLGHGTGSITALFKEAAVGQSGVRAEVSTNPHNQTFAVAIQIGLLGAVVLWAMWLMQLAWFWQAGIVAWTGLVMVTQSLVGSLFNSYIFDFTEGWLYVIGVGVAAGTLRRFRSFADEPKKAPPFSPESATPLALPPRPRILVVTLRRLGDVLLTTPLIRSLRRAFPDAVIEALVFSDTAGIVQDNPDLDGIVAMPPRPAAAQSLVLAARLWRKYDLAVSTQCGDRPTFFAIVAGRRRAAPVEVTASGRLKRALLDRSVPYAAGVHRVEEILRLADTLGIARVPELVCPRPGAVTEVAGRYAVIHVAPMFRYKRWTIEGWRSLAAWFGDNGIDVVATGGTNDSERGYLDEVCDGSAQIRRLDGRLSWPQLAGLLANACVYVGPDTSVTHLAAAAGCPTVAIYGPTDPRLWGPWPADGLGVMWDAAGRIQNRGNVWLVQNPLPCLPCQLEGCERGLDSHSSCLDELNPGEVIAAVQLALKGGAALRSG